MNGKIAFTTNRDGNAEIYSMNPDGTRQTNLTKNAGGDSEPAWSANGRRIAFVSSRDGNNEIYVMSGGGTGQTRLTRNAADDQFPTWSPDGRRIAFARTFGPRHAEIWVMNADGSGQTNLTTDTPGPVFPADYAAAWSPRGDKIAFGRVFGDTRIEIYVMDADGSAQTALTSNGVNSRFPDWLPDGSAIAFDRGRPGRANIYVMTTDGSRQIKITGHEGWVNQDAAWSPDGNRIAFTTSPHFQPDIYAINPNGTGWTRLTDDGGSDADPSWQPIADRNCPNFDSQAAAQDFFERYGGPDSDPARLDSDHDGIACESRGAPYRGLLSIEYSGRGDAFRGRVQSPHIRCRRRRGVRVFQARRGPDRLVGEAIASSRGPYSLPARPPRGRYYARTVATAECLRERSETISIGGA